MTASDDLIRRVMLEMGAVEEDGMLVLSDKSQDIDYIRKLFFERSAECERLEEKLANWKVEGAKLVEISLAAGNRSHELETTVAELREALRCSEQASLRLAAELRKAGRTIGWLREVSDENERLKKALALLTQQKLALYKDARAARARLTLYKVYALHRITELEADLSVAREASRLRQARIDQAVAELERRNLRDVQDTVNGPNACIDRALAAL